ncbi:MAG: UDP-glucose 4-epimerase GalE [Acidimicrobiia bacterium]|nr:UDP-glucose 4-epimerase GalE [Acidimicrobiia bacterium]
MPRVIVTGGAGYLGGHIVRTLSAASCDVVVVDDLRNGDPRHVGPADLVPMNVASRRGIRGVFRDWGPFDVLVHLAGTVGSEDARRHPLSHFSSNVAATIGLIEEASAGGVQNFIAVSTAAVYGDAGPGPIHESTWGTPTTAYGESHAMFETVLKRFAHERGPRATILRVFNAAGAAPDGMVGERHFPESHLIPKALQTASGLRPRLEILGDQFATPDGRAIRDYVHPIDVAAAVLLSAEQLLDGSPGGIFNIGSGVGHSVNEVCAMVNSVTGSTLPTVVTKPRQGAVGSLVADIERAGNVLGWSPGYSDLQTIVSTAWAWHASRIGAQDKTV